MVRSWPDRHDRSRELGDVIGITCLGAALLLAASPEPSGAQEIPAAQVVPAVPDTPPVTQVEGQSDVVVTGRDTRGDPAAAINAQVLEVAEGVDKALVGPAARAYETGNRTVFE